MKKLDIASMKSEDRTGGFHEQESGRCTFKVWEEEDEEATVISADIPIKNKLRKQQS
jgi:hypothetical protein